MCRPLAGNPSQQDTNAISGCILPVTVPVATEILEHLDQATMQDKPCRQSHLVYIWLGKKGCQHQSAVANGVLSFVPPFEYVKGRKVRRRA